MFRRIKREHLREIEWQLSLGALVVAMLSIAAGAVYQFGSWINAYGWAGWVLAVIAAAAVLSIVAFLAFAALNQFENFRRARSGSDMPPPIPGGDEATTVPASVLKVINDLQQDAAKTRQLLVEVGESVEALRGELTRNNLRTHNLDFEVERTIHVGLDLLKLSSLQKAIEDAPAPPYVDLSSTSFGDESIKQSIVAREYVESACKTVRASGWDVDIQNLLIMAEGQADRWVTDLSAEERPARIDVLQYRIAAIEKYKCDFLVRFLKAKRREIEEELLPSNRHKFWEMIGRRRDERKP